MSKRPPAKAPRRAAPAPASDTRFRILLVVAALAVVVAYAPSFGIPYLFDDHDAIERNPYFVDAGSLGWLLHVPENSTLIARPFLSWTFGASALLLGHTPAIHHFFNLLVHLANVVLVALLCRRALAYAGFSGTLRDVVSVAIACVWGVHPLNVQAVGYLIQRGESLATSFELFTLLAWIRTTEPQSRPHWRWLACAGPLLAVATKEHGWIAPLLPLLWAWVFQARAPLAEVGRFPVFYAIGAASWALLAALTWTGGRLEHVEAEAGITPVTYFLTQPEVLTHYLRLFFVPLGQSFDYDWQVATLPGALPWLALWSALFAATAWAVWKRKPIGFAAAVVFVSLASSSSFIALPDLAFEHRFYLAGACVAAIALATVAHFARRAPLAVPIGAACAALALGVLTYHRCTLFHSELAVWSEAVERNPEQRRALSNVGGILLQQGKPAEALASLKRVEALGIPSRMQTRVRFQIGNALLDLGRHAEARTYYHEALKTVQGDPGAIYMNLGHAHLRDGRFAEARAMFERALETMPRNANLQFDLAYACAEMGDLEPAMRAYEAGIRLGGRPQADLKELMAVVRPDLR